MNLQGIVSVSGKPGLWRALAQNKTGYILESLDANKTKLVANLSTAKIAALNEITLFGEAEDIKLTDIFERIKSASGIPDAKADGKVLRGFFREVAPGHDEEKVYASDMKKVITWFQLLKDLPFFNEEENADEVEEESPLVTEAPQAVDEPILAEETETVADEPKKTVEESPATTNEPDAVTGVPKVKPKKPAAKKQE